jgi:ribose/xylose/arabinose/galactoside ABC-type transport system permease subunit
LRLVVTADFQPFFTASVAASAALIGLLFVSVSIAPERVFGQQSDAARQAQALSAFTALANVFFISMMGLIPGVLFGLVVTIVSLPAIVQTMGLLALVRPWHRSGILRRGLLLFLASAAIYGYELSIGLQMWRSPTDRAELISLLFVLMGAYAVGLGRAWELLGAPRTGISSYIWALISALRRKPQP